MVEAITKSNLEVEAIAVVSGMVEAKAVSNLLVEAIAEES